MNLRSSLVLVVLPLAACAEPSPRSVALTTADSTAISEVKAAYVRSWLADDTLGVLETLSPDAVLLPPGHEPVIGHADIRAYWWPDDGSHTTIESFDWTLAEMGGEADLAYTRGSSTLDWVWEKDTVRQANSTRSFNLTLLRRQPDGGWKISHQIWGPAIK